MATQSNNPFVLPGFGQSGDMAGNPLMASMEMMRQAWQGLANAGSGLEHSALATPMSLEDLDRRISDLRAVENWLRMNLSMLSSTIQGLEVQRATISTLKSFMDGAGTTTAGTAASGPSPLEVVLGIKPQAAPAPSQPAATAAPASAPANDQQEAPAADPAQALNPAAAQGWWDMLQNQFDHLAAATAATLQSAEAMRAAASSQEVEGASSDSTLGRASRAAPKKAPRSAKTASQSASKTVKKAAARKRTPPSRSKDS